MDQEQINITQAPGLILRFCHLQGVLSSVVVVPELGHDEDVLSFDNARGNCPSDAGTSLRLILIVICAIKKSIAGFDSLDIVSWVADIIEVSTHLINDV